VVDGSSYAPAPVQQKNTETAQSAAPTQQNNTGVGETKREYDPRLLESNKESWTSSGAMCFQEICFYANGTFMYMNFCPSAGDDTVRGTWYTRNDTLFQRAPRDNDYLSEYSAEKYFIDEDYFESAYGTFSRLKR
jgi:hypothetical protein